MSTLSRFPITAIGFYIDSYRLSVQQIFHGSDRVNLRPLKKAFVRS
jgi:hypothetical protein